jgi:ferric-dicitrate binding protein FerR (iron transport regulator)
MMNNIIRWPTELESHEAEFDEAMETLDRLAVPDATGVAYAEAAAGDRSIARAVIGWLCVLACALMVVALMAWATP